MGSRAKPGNDVFLAKPETHLGLPPRLGGGERSGARLRPRPISFVRTYLRRAAGAAASGGGQAGIEAGTDGLHLFRSHDQGR